MRSTLLLSLLTLLFLPVAQAQSETLWEYVRPKAEAARLLRAFHRLPLGCEQATAIRVLGKPDFQNAISRKETSKIFGYRIGYYLKRAQLNFVSMGDRYLVLRFDPNHRLKSREHVRGYHVLPGVASPPIPNRR